MCVLCHTDVLASARVQLCSQVGDSMTQVTPSAVETLQKQDGKVLSVKKQMHFFRWRTCSRGEKPVVLPEEWFLCPWLSTVSGTCHIFAKQQGEYNLESTTHQACAFDHLQSSATLFLRPPETSRVWNRVGQWNESSGTAGGADAAHSSSPFRPICCAWANREKPRRQTKNREKILRRGA